MHPRVVNNRPAQNYDTSFHAARQGIRPSCAVGSVLVWVRREDPLASSQPAAARSFHCKGRFQQMLKTRITSQWASWALCIREDDSVRLSEGEYNRARARSRPGCTGRSCGDTLRRNGPKLESVRSPLRLPGGPGDQLETKTVAAKSCVFSRTSL